MTRTTEGNSFVIKGPPGKVLRVFSAYARIGRTLKRRGEAMSHRAWSFGLAWLAWTAAAFALTSERNLHTFETLAATGPLFCVLAAVAVRTSSDRGTHPRLRPRHSHSEAMFLVLLVGGIFFVLATLFAGPPLNMNRGVAKLASDLFARAQVVLHGTYDAIGGFFRTSSGIARDLGWPPSWHGQTPVIVAGTGSATLFVLWITYAGAARRFRNVTTVEPELAWLRGVLDGLLSEAPESARVTLRFNPFPAVWSEERIDNARQRGGYTYPASIDRPLALAVAFPGGLTFTLSMQLMHVTKIKNRKGKYKGTKYRLQQVMRFRHPAFGSLVPESFLREAIDEALASARMAPVTATTSGSGRDRVEWIGGQAVQADTRVEGGKVAARWSYKTQDFNHGATLVYVDPAATVTMAMIAGKRLAAALDGAALAGRRADAPA